MTDISVPTRMKNAAKCDTWCESQGSASHPIFERNWHLCFTQRCIRSSVAFLLSFNYILIWLNGFWVVLVFKLKYNVSWRIYLCNKPVQLSLQNLNRKLFLFYRIFLCS